MLWSDRTLLDSARSASRNGPPHHGPLKDKAITLMSEMLELLRKSQKLLMQMVL